jgi:alpha-1,3-rhamnosyl/mannosyltransferase
VRAVYDLPERYGLILATLEPRKNVEGAILAFSRYCSEQRDSSLALVVVGGNRWSTSVLSSIAQSLPIRDRIRFLGYVPSGDRPALYAESSFFFFPSFAEGFGFPPLEAASQGTPVITSARSALPEIIGDAALFA